MYELIILSLLMHQPLHGYLIAKITNDMIGPWAKISNGTLYPLLTRLEKAGLITTSPEGSEQQRGDHRKHDQAGGDADNLLLDGLSKH